MPTKQSFSIQCEQLAQLKSFLQQFDNEMQQKLIEYKQRIASLRESGLPIETAEKFTSEMISETENCIRKNSDYINKDIIPFLNKNIGILDELMNGNKIGTRVAAFGGAVVATVSGTVALGFQKDTNEHNAEVPSAHHVVLDSQAKTPLDLAREMAKDTHDVIESLAEIKKRKDETEEIEELSNALRKHEQGEYTDT